MDVLAQLGPWFIVLTVVVMYSIFFWARSRGKKRWPPGHPWAPISLLLLAFQQLVRQYHWDIGPTWSSAVSTITLVTVALWIWTGVQEYRTAKNEARQKDPNQGTKPPDNA